jgi:hypothetical protein
VLILAASALSLLALNAPAATTTRTKPPSDIMIRPGSTAHFANLDWNCTLIPLQLLNGRTAPLLSCKEKNRSGLVLLLTKTHLELKTCQNGHCTTLLRRSRAP